MFAQRQVLRALRTPAIQRRFASTAPKAGENAFVAERRAVKEHAAESTGRSKQNHFWADVHNETNRLLTQLGI